MIDSYVIIGTGEYSRTVIDIAKKLGHEITGLIDLGNSGDTESILGVSVLGGPMELKNYPKGTIRCIVAVKDNAERREQIEFLTEAGYDIGTLIHPGADISDSVRIGRGTVVHQGVVINMLSEIGDGCVISTGCVVDQDCVIGHYSNLSTGCTLGAGVEVGNESVLGVGAIVSEGIKIGESTMIEAGSVLTKHLETGYSISGVR
jgi:UDP-perosamine 4-acetyltransferase